MKKLLTVLMPSWHGPELLRYSIPGVLRSFTGDSKLIVILNDYDKESVDICVENGVEFLCIKENWGTLGCDLIHPYYLNSEFVAHINSDMIPSLGWDTNLTNIIKNSSTPCSASTQLVEPYGTGNPLVIVDNLGDFSLVEQKFQENYKAGKYSFNRDSVIGYNHPIVVKIQDYFNVSGYSNNLDQRFRPLCYGLDDHFAWRLWKIYGGVFKHISSGKDFTYHCISATNNKIDKAYRDANNGMNHFQADSQMDIWQFRNNINAFSKV